MPALTPRRQGRCRPRTVPRAAPRGGRRQGLPRVTLSRGARARSPPGGPQADGPAAGWGARPGAGGPQRRGSAAPGLPRAGGPVELGLVPGPAPPAARRDGPSRAGRALPLLSRRFRLQVSLAAAPLRRSRSSPLRALGRFLSTLKSVSGGGRRAGVAAAAAPIATGWGVGDRSVSPSGRRPNATEPAGRAAGRDRRVAGGAWGGKWMRREEERSGGTRRDRRRGESGRR